MALRFILASSGCLDGDTRDAQTENVERNIAASDGNQLDLKLLEDLRQHRWVRTTKIE